MYNGSSTAKTGLCPDEMIDEIERRKRTKSKAGEEKNQKQKEVV